jgi:hypothetical protein
MSQLFASPLLVSYCALLSSYPLSLRLVQKVQVHPLLLSPTNAANWPTKRKPSMSSGSVAKDQKERYLGDYVSKDKIENVKETCKRVYGPFFSGPVRDLVSFTYCRRI